MILLCIGNDRDATATNSYNVATNANLTGLAKRMDATTASGVGGGVSLHEGLMATVGNTGTSSVTKLTAHTASAGYTTVALRPARRVYKFS